MEETFNKHNDRVNTWSSKEARKLVPRIERGHYPASVMVWWGGITSLLFCEKGVKTAARNYQQDILTNVVEPLNQTMFQNRPWIFQQDSAPAHKGKKCNSGLKIMCPNLLVMTSPDLNPLDLKLWSVLEGMVCTRYSHNLKSLKQVLWAIFLWMSSIQQ